MHVIAPIIGKVALVQAREGMGSPSKAWGTSGRHGKSRDGKIPGWQNPQDCKIPGTTKSPGWLNPREGKIPGRAKSPGLQNHQDNKIPGNPGQELLVFYISVLL